MGIDNRTPSKAEQDREASERNRSILDDNGNEIGADPRQDGIDDATGEALDPPRQRDQLRNDDDADNNRTTPFRGSPSDQKRLEIAARFKRNKDGEADPPYNGDPNDPEMQYGRVAQQQLEPDPGASLVGGRTERSADQDDLDGERMITRTVRGKSVTKTLAAWLEDASKVSAADSYLEEGRTLLEDAREMRRNSAQRTGQDPQHPEDRTGEQDDDLNLDQGQDRQHPDELEAAIEEIQFGDPKDAAKKIRSVIARAADESTDKRQLDRLIANDLTKSQTELKAFLDQNPELKDDESANVLMEKYMYDVYRDDITSMGIDPNLIPKDNNELANWHRFYRVHGKPVKTAAEALTIAKQKLDGWRGPSAQSRPEPRRQQPRVEVSVDREERRRNIQTQPSRAATPRPDAVRQAPERKSRHDIIMDMRRSRGRPVA